MGLESALSPGGVAAGRGVLVAVGDSVSKAELLAQALPVRAQNRL